MPCMKRVYIDKKASLHYLAARKKSVLLVPLIKRKPLINRWSTADFVPLAVYIGFSLFVLLESRSSAVSSMPWREQ